MEETTGFEELSALVEKHLSGYWVHHPNATPVEGAELVHLTLLADGTYKFSSHPQTARFFVTAGPVGSLRSDERLVFLAECGWQSSTTCSLELLGARGPDDCEWVVAEALRFPTAREVYSDEHQTVIDLGLTYPCGLVQTLFTDGRAGRTSRLVAGFEAGDHVHQYDANYTSYMEYSYVWGNVPQYSSYQERFQQLQGEGCFDAIVPPWLYEAEIEKTSMQSPRVTRSVIRAAGIYAVLTAGGAFVVCPAEMLWIYVPFTVLKTGWRGLPFGPILAHSEFQRRAAIYLEALDRDLSSGLVSLADEVRAAGSVTDEEYGIFDQGTFGRAAEVPNPDLGATSDLPPLAAEPAASAGPVRQALADALTTAARWLLETGRAR